MRLAQTVPMTKPEAGYGGGTFCSVREAFSLARKNSGGRLLCVLDGTSCSLIPHASDFDAVCIVLDREDILPLFSLPEGADAVFAAGGRGTMLAARAFSAIERVPCFLAPSEASLDGVFGENTVRAGGEEIIFPPSEAKIFYDVSLCAPTLPAAYARLLLSRLALFEQRALEQLEERTSVPLDGMFDALLVLDKEPDSREILLCNERLRIAEAQGAPKGEGIVLAGLYREEHSLRAFCELYALYAAFFKRGRPRKYCVPDYKARGKEAGTGASEPPSAEKFARRALLLERKRHDLLREIERIGEKRERYLSRAATISGRRYLPENDLSVLKYLPEHSPNGLSAFIRDFGLMEW